MNVQVQGTPISVNVNGQAREATVEPGLLLADFLRDTLGMTGTKVGCETGQCGACTVLLDGISVKSCTVLAVQVGSSQVTTIEGVGSDGNLSPLQQAFWENHALQCGYCTPAMVLALTDLLARNPKPSDADIRVWLDGIMCRCGVFQNAVRAVQSVAGGR